MTSMSHVDEIVCRQLVERVTEYLEGDLDDSTRERIEEHLAECDHCRLYVEQMRTTTRVLRVARTAELPGERKRELLDAFRAWSRERGD